MLINPAVLPVYAPPASLRVDGVSRNLGDLAVLEGARRDAFPGTFPYVLEFAASAARSLPGMRDALPGHVLEPGRAMTAVWLRALRPLLLRARTVRPRFVLCTIDRVEVRPSVVRIVGACAPLLVHASASRAPAIS